MSVNFMTSFDMTSLTHFQKTGSTHPNPDQYFGLLKISSGSFHFEVSQRDTIDYYEAGYRLKSGKMLDYPTMAVILESPHRYEYNPSNHPVGLMMGLSGENFIQMFSDVISRSQLPFRNNTYSVMVMNAIQYQTSCGLNPLDRSIRDANWFEIYEQKGGKEDLKKRIFTLKPQYTLNLCTGGMSPTGIRSTVSRSLDEWGLKKGKHYTEGNHPASWNVRGDTSHAVIY